MILPGGRHAADQGGFTTRLEQADPDGRDLLLLWSGRLVLMRPDAAPLPAMGTRELVN